MKIAHIRLTDWGIALNGEHFSVDVWYDDKSFEIKHELTTGQAGRLNKKDGGRSNRPGDKSYRFETEQGAIKEAVNFCRSNFSPIDVIFVGNPAWADPMPVAWAADKNIEETLTSLADQYEGVDDCSGEYYDIIKKWDECLNQ